MYLIQPDETGIHPIPTSDKSVLPERVREIEL